MARELKGGNCLAPYKKMEHGTLGYFAKCRTEDGSHGIISAGHVMQSVGEQRLLVPPSGPPYGGRYECGSNTDHKLQHQVAEVMTLSNDDTNVDCGFAKLTVDGDYFELEDGLVVDEVAKDRHEIGVGDNVRFYGCTTEGSGSVASNKFLFPVNGRIFENQIRLTTRSRPGDSGALVVHVEDCNVKAIGLVIANDGGTDGAVANPIHEVEDALGVDLITDQ